MASTVGDRVRAIRDEIADRIGQQKFRTWFGDATTFHVDENRLDVTVGNHFVCTWIESNYMTAVSEAVREVLGAQAVATVAVRADPPSAPHGRPQVRTAPAPGDAVFRKDLDSFVVGPTNALAYSAARTVIRSLAREFKPLVVHSACGLGKTHLLQGVCTAVSREQPSWSWRYVAGEDFTNEYITAVQVKRVDAFRARYRKVDLLVVDDIHFLANKPHTQEEFLHTFNAIDAAGRQVVLASDCHPRQLTAFSEPLSNRLVSGMVVKIGAPDLKMRREILARRAQSMRADVPEDVLDYLARHVTANVRELEGALYRLVALAALSKDRPSLDLARVAIEDYLTRSHSPNDAAHLERTVAAFFGCSREMLHSDMRSRNVTLARGIAMYMIRKRTHMSFPEIGRFMGNKNHSTVLMACRRVEKTLSAGGAVEWLTADGPERAALGDVLQRIEQELTRPRS